MPGNLLDRDEIRGATCEAQDIAQKFPGAFNDKVKEEATDSLTPRQRPALPPKTRNGLVQDTTLR
jgi:hypothetical protein